MARFQQFLKSINQSVNQYNFLLRILRRKEKRSETNFQKRWVFRQFWNIVRDLVKMSDEGKKFNKNNPE